MGGNRGAGVVGLSIVLAVAAVPEVVVSASVGAPSAAASTTMPAAAVSAVSAALRTAQVVAPVGVLKPTELTSSDPSGVGLFGSSVAVLGDTLVVGAKGRTGAGVYQGAVFVFTKPASGWAHAQQVAELTATDGAAEDELGFSVAMTADTIVATAQNKKVGNNAAQGALYVWNKPSTGWRSSTQNAELLAGDGAAGDELDAVSMTENVIVAGAFSHKAGGHSNVGAAYVFTKPVGGWADTSTSLELTDPGGDTGDEFGLSVATLGQTVYVGAPGAVVSGAVGSQGAVYVYTSSDGTWGSVPPEHALFANNGNGGDEFGAQLAVSGTTLVASAPDRAVGATNLQGAVYVFIEPDGGWPVFQAQQAMLTQTDGQKAEQFGSSLAVSGDTIVAGATQHVQAGTESGVAYDFTKPATGWADASEAANLIPGDGAKSDLFGYRVAIDSDAIFVGAEEHQEPTEQGAVYAYAVPRPTLSAVRQSRPAWRAGKRAAVINPKHHLAGGTRLSFRLNDPATVSLTFRRHVGKARKPRGVLSIAAKTGTTTIYFDGVVSPTRKLTPGRYSVALAAKSSGGTSSTATLVFTIDKPKKPKKKH
jgi:hypothetical protein